MIEVYPLSVLIIDYCLGVVMWTLLGRAVLDFFVSAQSKMVIAVVFRQVTKPFIRLFAFVTPSFLLPVFVPIYVAWWFYMVRFYVMPLLFFGQFGTLSFPLESEIVQIIFG